MSTSLGFPYVADSEADKPAAVNAALDAINAYLDARRAPRYAAVYRDSATTLSSASGATDFTAVSFNQEREDAANMHDNSTNPSRLTAPVAGLYRVEAFLAFTANATGRRILAVVKNGGATVAENSTTGTSGGAAYLSTARTLRLTAGDYLEVLAWQDSGGSLDLLAGSATGQAAQEFVLVRIGD